ncbi:MAG: transposase [Myxococcales bacterium]|nr:transposase [Myxococcales bacterium]
MASVALLQPVDSPAVPIARRSRSRAPDGMDGARLRLLSWVGCLVVLTRPAMNWGDPREPSEPKEVTSSELGGDDRVCTSELVTEGGRHGSVYRSRCACDKHDARGRGPERQEAQDSCQRNDGKALFEALKTIPEPRHEYFEEGTQAEWLFQILRPHAAEVVVAKVESSRGQKSDAKDAFGLAELLRTGKIGTRVFKDVGAFATLRDLSRLYSMLRDDVVRTKNRIKSRYRSRGVVTPDGDVYASKHRAKWLKTLTPGKRLVAEKLYDELDK